jgi:hypothetical protein
MRQGWPRDVADRVLQVDCRSAQAGSTIWFAAITAWATAMPRDCSHNDPACCGLACTATTSADGIWTNGTSYWNGYCDNIGCCSTGTAGILCCRNPELTGS